MNYAGFWLRAASAIIDSLILAIAGTIVSLLLTYSILFVMFIASGTFSVEYSGPLNLGISILLGTLYFAVFESSESQATPGKQMLGMKVTGLDGGRISFLRAFWRYYARILSGLVLFLGYIMMVFTEKKQTLHDMLCQTLVVRNAGAEP